MAITHFISTVWSENLIQQMDNQYISAINCNRDYEGDIREQGEMVKICGLEPVMIADYQKNSDIGAPDILNDTVADLFISQAKYFNFAIDDIDRAQASPKLMDLALKNAASALANAADAYIMKVCKSSSKYTLTQNDPVSESNVLDLFFKARTILAENNVCNPNDIVFEVSPKIAEFIMRAKLDLGMTTETLENGCIGNIAGCKVFVSNNIVVENNSDKTQHCCIARTKRAVAFAEQLSEIEAYRPDYRFADALKGLHLYGAKVVVPDELVVMKITV